MNDHEIAYYSTVAQVVPLLMLALVIEVRFSSWLLPPRSRGAAVVLRWAIYGVLVLSFAAELLAIAALRTDSASSGDRLVTSLGVLFPLGPVFLAVVTLSMKEVRKLSPAQGADDEHDESDEDDGEGDD